MKTQKTSLFQYFDIGEIEFEVKDFSIVKINKVEFDEPKISKPKTYGLKFVIPFWIVDNIENLKCGAFKMKFPLTFLYKQFNEKEFIENEINDGIKEAEIFLNKIKKLSKTKFKMLDKWNFWSIVDIDI